MRGSNTTTNYYCSSGSREEEGIVLVCEVCKGRTLVGALLAVWRSESTTFHCCECGERLTLANRLECSKEAKQQLAQEAATTRPSHSTTTSTTNQTL